MNMQHIRFTVAVSAYNVEAYIGRALESVVHQDFENYEIVVVDDCSTDNTVEEIKKYQSDKVRLFKTKTNTGTAGGTRNVAIDNARGEYIIFLDGDDTLYDNKTLQKIDRVIGEEKPDLVFLGYEDVGQGNKERISNEENSTKKARLICDLSFSVSSRCWKKEFLVRENMKFVEGMYYEDNIKVFKYYRNVKGSVMSKPTIKKCSDWYRMLAEVMDLYRITPDEYKPYLLSFIKNENESIPIRIGAILKAMERNEQVKLLPKRNYQFKDFYQEDSTRIFLVRHTETIGNIEERLMGRKDYEITDTGNALSLQLTKKLEDIKFDEIYSSPANRAMQTVKLLAEKNNVKIQEAEQLQEMYFGIYDDWKWEDVNKIQPEIKENQNRTNEICGIPEQESMQEVADRMYEYIKKIAELNKGKTILISSHGVAIEAFLRKITNVPFGDEREKYCQHYCAINEVEYKQGKFYIKQLADVSYLEEKR